MLSNTAVQFAEPFQLEDIYVDRLGAIEDAGDGNTRFVFCVSKRGSIEVKVHLVAGPTLIWHTIKLTMQHFGKKCCGVGERMSH